MYIDKFRDSTIKFQIIYIYTYTLKILLNHIFNCSVFTIREMFRLLIL